MAKPKSNLRGNKEEPEELPKDKGEPNYGPKNLFQKMKPKSLLGTTQCATL